MREFIVNVDGVPVPVTANNLEDAQAAVAEAVQSTPDFLTTLQNDPAYQAQIQTAVQDFNAREEFSSGTALERFGAGALDTARDIGLGALQVGSFIAKTQLPVPAVQEGISDAVAPIAESVEARNEAFDVQDRQQFGAEDFGQNVDLVAAGGALARQGFKLGTAIFSKSINSGLIKLLGRKVDPKKAKKFKENVEELLKDTDAVEALSKVGTKEATDNATIIANSPTPEVAAQAVTSARRAKQIEAFKRIKREEDLINDIRTKPPVNDTVPRSVEPDVIPPPPGFQVPGGATQATLPFNQAAQGASKTLPRFRANPDGTFTQL